MNLEPWQQRIFDKMKSFKGKGAIQITGRNTGKSFLSSSAFRRLFDDIYNRPVEELLLTEGTVYGARYYCVEPLGGNWPEMEHWAIETYGDPGSIWSDNKAPEPAQRWYMNNRKFWFRSVKDRDWFILRWNS